MSLVTKIAQRLSSIPVRSAYFLRTGYWHTGERVNPDFRDETFTTCIAAYHFTQQMVSGKVVLDVGCGTGAGTDLLAHYAKGVIGIDLSLSAVRFARNRYQRPRFVVMDAHELKFPNASFDFIHSSENFEHLEDQAMHLQELRRVLKPGGICFIATPNPDVSAGQSCNPYHIKENSYLELKELFARQFKESVIIESTFCRKPNRGLIPGKTAAIFGHKIDTQHLLNHCSFYCFLR